MADTKQAQIACVGGEISESMWARMDISKVKLGLARCRNFVVLPQGGVSFRPGTLFVRELSAAARLMFMEPDTLLVFWPGKVGALNVETGAWFEADSPYQAQSLQWLRSAQSVDVLFLCDGITKPRVLKNYGGSIAIEEYVPEDGPFLPMNQDRDFNLTVTGSSGAVGSSVTVTASRALFASGDVGRYVRILYWDAGGKMASGAVEAGPTGVVSGSQLAVDGHYDFRYYFGDSDAGTVDLEYSLDGGTTWEVYDSFSAHTGTTRVVTDFELRPEMFGVTSMQMRLRIPVATKAFTWTLIKRAESRAGVLRVTGYTSATQVTAVVRRRCAYLGKATHRWALGAWGRGEWPRVVTFHQSDRLMWGNVPSAPADIWGTAVGDYYEFYSPVEPAPDAPVTLSVRSRYVDNITALVPLRDMVVLAEGGEWILKSSSGTLSPDDAVLSPQGTRGSSWVPPLVTGGSVLFVQKDRRTVRSLSYSFEKDGYDSVDRTILASHLFRGHSVRDWCYQQSPWSVVWAVRDDGKVLGFTWLEDHDIWAWHLHDFGGAVISVAEGAGSVYMVVKRGERYFLEMLSNPEDGVYLDCAVMEETGLGHLEGQRVSVVMDDVIHRDNVLVVDGKVVPWREYQSIVVGLPYTGMVQTLPLVFEDNGGLTISRRMKLTDVAVSVRDSFGGEAGTHIDYLLPFQYEHNALTTGFLRSALETGFDDMNQVIIRQNGPFPLNIQSWSVGVVVGD